LLLLIARITWSYCLPHRWVAKAWALF